MLKLVGYARVSSEEQRNNTSLPEQRRTIEEFCQMKNHDLVGFYQDVESGSTLERENLKWAIKTVFSAADGLVIYRLDRLSRSVLDAEKIKHTFADRGKVVISVLDPIDMESETGEFIYTISSAVAELERMRILKRCKEGLQAKKKAGGYYSGRPPYGYAAWRGTLVEVPGEQQVIKLIMKLFFVEGYTYTGIARYLNERGIPSKSGKEWYLQGIRRIVSNENTYIIDLLQGSGKILPAAEFEVQRQAIINE